jgi:DNA-directed RNA polymerase subunit M/transcription elongation factor TFIIS
MNTNKNASEHRRDSSPESVDRKKKEGKVKEEENKKEVKREDKLLDEYIYDVWQDEPEDEWLCPTCNHSPCSFVQWQEELERIVDLMHPEATNKSKRYHMYKHIIRRLHGTLGKGNRKEVPVCFSQGLADLYPSEYYTGYKPNPFESGPRGDRHYDLM